MRIGVGYDAHRLEAGQRLVLGGVTIPYEQGLLGHSDGDVLVHACIDALLGAAALGDIGAHFPSSDESLRGAASVRLLEQVGRLLSERGWRVVNLDATIAAERPRLAPSIPEMRQNISRAVGVEQGQVSIKASTTDGLGFEGQGQGISAYAVVLIDQRL